MFAIINSMDNRIQEAIAGFREVENGIGHYIKDILEEFGTDAVYSELNGMFQDSDIEKFLLAIEFTLFVSENLSYIPGKNDKELMDKMREAKLFESLIETFAQKKLYYHLNILFSLISHLPAELPLTRLEELIERYRQENCILLIPLVRALTEFLGNVFPVEKYNAISIEDSECRFIVKYSIAQSEYLDAFGRMELLEQLTTECPEKYRTALEECMASNKKYMSEDYFGDDDEDEEEDDVQNVIDDYFDYCDDLIGSGKSITFERFIHEGKLPE